MRPRPAPQNRAATRPRSAPSRRGEARGAGSQLRGGKVIARPARYPTLKSPIACMLTGYTAYCTGSSERPVTCQAPRLDIQSALPSGRPLSAIHIPTDRCSPHHQPEKNPANEEKNQIFKSITTVTTLTIPTAPFNILTQFAPLQRPRRVHPAGAISLLYFSSNNAASASPSANASHHSVSDAITSPRQRLTLAVYTSVSHHRRLDERH